MHKLFRGGTIDKRGYDAANRFLDDCSRASSNGGAASFLGSVISRSIDPHTGAIRQSEMLRRVVRTMLYVRITPSTVFWWVVIDNRSPEQFAATLSCRTQVAYDLLRKELSDLDDYYRSVQDKRRA